MGNVLVIVREAETQKDVLTARRLFEDYAGWLGIDLGFQSFDEELASLPGAYTRPTGLILFAEHGETIVGCVALRRIEDGIGEVKRLYVDPAYRGQKIGRRLMDHLIEEAKGIGYSKLRLDTLPQMHTARGLYASLGFKKIAPYYYNPIEGTEFMELALS